MTLAQLKKKQYLCTVNKNSDAYVRYKEKDS